MENKEFKMLIFSLILFVFTISYVIRQYEPVFDRNNSYNDIYKLEKQNDSLKKEISLELIKISEYQCKVDSLESLKPQVIIKYVQKNKSIDNANVNDLVNEYKGIFTKSNIK
jgi:hypothetical protein